MDKHQHISQNFYIQASPVGSLRSCDQGLLAVHDTRLKMKGDRAFAAVAPRLSPTEIENCGLSGVF